MKLGYVLMAWGLYVSPTVLRAAQALPVIAALPGSPGTMPSSAANLETMQCPGPVSTKESGCHSEDDQTGSGEAGFQFKGYTFSEPFHLIVSYDWLILQGPSAPIFEGDPLVLRCRAWQDWPITQITFYRDGSALGPPGPNWEFSVSAVQKADSGHYHCSATFQSPGPGSPETASPVAIRVQELFTDPVLRASPSAELREGSPVTLHCHTKTNLSLQRAAARLLFSFHQDGRPVLGRGHSAEFQIPQASREHSGYYWCEVATEDGQVWKRSPWLEVRVQGPSSSAAPHTLDPTLQKPAAPEEPAAKPPGPLPAAPSAEHPGCSPADPYLQHQMGILLKQVQAVRVVLSHLVMELRGLTAHRKPGTSKAE